MRFIFESDGVMKMINVIIQILGQPPFILDIVVVETQFFQPKTDGLQKDMPIVHCSLADMNACRK